MLGKMFSELSIFFVIENKARWLQMLAVVHRSNTVPMVSGLSWRSLLFNYPKHQHCDQVLHQRLAHPNQGVLDKDPAHPRYTRFKTP